jgi:hypothetical protein
MCNNMLGATLLDDTNIHDAGQSCTVRGETSKQSVAWDDDPDLDEEHNKYSRCACQLVRREQAAASNC